MGAANALLVSNYWKHLGHREHRLLTFMALVSLDTGAPPVYFGGWQAGARHLGLDPDMNPNSSAESFRQVISKLRRAGAVVANGGARQGSRAEYALTLDLMTTAAPTLTRGGNGRPVTTWSVVHRQDPRPPSSPNDPLPPRRTEEPLQEYSEEESVGSQPPSPAPVENSSARTLDGIDPAVYAAASAFLQARPMQHLVLMERAAAELGPGCSVRRQVVTAATLAGCQPKEATA